MKISTYAATVFIFSAIIAFLVYFKYDGSLLAFKDNIANEAGKLAGTLAVVALFLERSISVVNAALNNEQQTAVNRLLIGGKWVEAENIQASIDASSERVRLAVGTIAGLFVSFIGIRTLGSLVKTPPDNAFFDIVDIFLTAGLLAGGSNGMALLVEALKKPIQLSIAKAKSSLFRISQEPK